MAAPHVGHGGQELLALEQDDPEAPITMLVNSPGGSVTDGFAIYDMMRFVRQQLVREGFTEEQIVRILKEVDAGAKVNETCRKHGISEPTYYAWKSKYAGLEVSQLRHLKDVETELARMKRMYAELALEHHALKDVLSRKG